MSNKKKTHQGFEKYISDTAKPLIRIMGLDLHVFKVEFDDSEKYLGSKCNYPYLDLKIVYSEKAFQDFLKGKITRRQILHEICHVITDPLFVKAIERWSSKNEINDERERLTDVITRIIERLL